MSVLNPSYTNVYTAAGTTGPYPITFSCILDISGNAQDIIVQVVDSAGLTTDITATATIVGKNVYTALAYDASHTIVLVRYPAVTQPYTFPFGTKFPSKTFENALDRLLYLVQRGSGDADLALKAPFAEVGTPPSRLPTIADRASKHLAFDASGNPIGSLGVPSVPATAWAATLLAAVNLDSAQTVLGISAYIKTLLDDADAAAARATLDIYSRDKTSGLAGETIAIGDLVGFANGKLYKIGYSQYGNPPLTSESNCQRSAFARLNDTDFICVKSYSTSQHVQYRVGRVDFTQTNWFTWLTSWTDVATSLGGGTPNVQVEPIYAENTVLILWGHVTNTDVMGQIATWNPATTTLTLVGSPSTILAGTLNPGGIYAVQAADVGLPNDVFVVCRDTTAANTLNFLVVRWNGSTLSFSGTVATVADTSVSGWPTVGALNPDGLRECWVIGRTVTGTVGNIHHVFYDPSTLATTYGFALSLNGDFTNGGDASGCLYLGGNRVLALMSGTRGGSSQGVGRIVEKYSSGSRGWFEINDNWMGPFAHNPRPRFGAKTGVFLLGCGIGGANQNYFVIGSVDRAGIRPRLMKIYPGALNFTITGGMMLIELSPGVFILPVANTGDSTMKMDVFRMPELLGAALNAGNVGDTISVDTMMLSGSSLSPGTEYLYDEEAKVITPNKRGHGIVLGRAVSTTQIRRT